MRIIDIINDSPNPVFSFEILPPLKGNSIYKVFDIVEKLKRFDPKFVNITSHHSEYIYKPLPDVRARWQSPPPYRTGMD